MTPLGHLDRSRLIATTLPQRRHVLLLPSLERRFSSSPKNDLRAAKRGLEDCASARFSTISRRAVDRPRIVTQTKDPREANALRLPSTRGAKETRQER